MGRSVTDLPTPWDASPYLLMAHGRSTVVGCWADSGSVVVALEGGRGVGLVGLGPADGVARHLGVAVAALSAQPGGWARVAWVTVPRETWHLLDAGAQAVLARWPAPSAWDCMWTYRPLVDAGDHEVERLVPGLTDVQEEVAATLARAHPTASTSPDDPRLVGWWGVRVAGRLAAVVGALRYAPGLAPHLVSLGVDPDHRGRGLAGAVLAAAVRDGLAAGTEVGPAAVWLGLYASNDVARRVYLRHGFELGHRFESRDAPG